MLECVWQERENTLLFRQLHQEVIGDDRLAGAGWPHKQDGDLVPHTCLQKEQLSGCLYRVDNEVCHLVREKEAIGEGGDMNLNGYKVYKNITT